jgi:integrase
MSEQLSTGTVDSWTHTFSAMTGRDFYMHSLRHCYTTSLAKSGIPDGVIQAIQGWETLEMVRVYDDTPQDEQIGAYFKNGEISAPKAKSLTDL